MTMKIDIVHFIEYLMEMGLVKLCKVCYYIVVATITSIIISPLTRGTHMKRSKKNGNKKSNEHCKRNGKGDSKKLSAT